MKIHFDKQEDAFYMRFNESPYGESDEIKEGIILDYDKRGKIIGIEILDASKKLPQKFRSDILKKEVCVE